ncbi:hypothetical protein GCM10011374_41240 [Kocuria dechangensis]|uniref:DUF2254 domain-containing protein n=1 Tax=Kocuria dechangensis TaxID=1176249 RepID=A0A917HAD2_9MICC|nr:DUF2254 domain-containing protein [Kocuria dechangensis]GGG72217.1 hypothetical protein GCM10011374_41240 [Kocuria dechangensis]
MGRLSGSWHRISGAFWFVPAVCLAAAAVLAQAVVAVDRALPDDLTSPWLSWVYAVGIDGSRSMLATIGAAMLGVAATAFSITISVVATATSTYGPRLVRNFMADRGNQAVLGVLVSTFLYTLLVLRTIRSADDDLAQPFVPHLAVNLAVVLAVADVVLLVYFIHHIAASVRVETLALGVRRNFRDVVERWHPQEAPEDLVRTARPRAGGGEISAGSVGYLVTADLDGLAALARHEDVVLALVPRVGDHVLPSEPLVRVWPGDRAEGVANRVRRCVRIGDSRSAAQDVRFAEQQVVELAVRALSPGTNDPYTAVNAIEEVAAGIVVAVSRPEPGNTVVEHGTARLHYATVDLEEIVDMPFDQIRPHATGHVEVLQALIDLAARVGQASRHPLLAHRVRGHVEALLDQFRISDPHPHDLHRVERHAVHRLAGEDGR